MKKLKLYTSINDFINESHIHINDEIFKTVSDENKAYDTYYHVSSGISKKDIATNIVNYLEHSNKGEFTENEEEMYYMIDYIVDTLTDDMCNQYVTLFNSKDETYAIENLLDTHKELATIPVKN